MIMFVYGKIAYTEYAKCRQNKSFDGQELLPWEELSTEIKYAWSKGAMAARWHLDSQEDEDVVEKAVRVALASEQYDSADYFTVPEREFLQQTFLDAFLD